MCTFCHGRGVVIYSPFVECSLVDAKHDQTECIELSETYTDVCPRCLGAGWTTLSKPDRRIYNDFIMYNSRVVRDYNENLGVAIVDDRCDIYDVRTINLLGFVVFWHGQIFR